MVNKYFEPGEQRAAKVNDLFATIAPRYDLINDLQSFGLHRWWKRRLLRLADPKPGERALDVCCGTGDISFGLARRGAEVVGVDFSDAMLAVARRRVGSWSRSAPPRSATGTPWRTPPSWTRSTQARWPIQCAQLIPKSRLCMAAAPFHSDVTSKRVRTIRARRQVATTCRGRRSSGRC